MKKKTSEVKEKSSLEKLLEKMSVVEVAFRTQISSATLYRWKLGKGKPNAALARLLDQEAAKL